MKNSYFITTLRGTLFLVFFLIFVGGFVRASGSGMGCPDWPKCFGRWVPPTQESQLPPNYQSIYAHRGYKDVRFNAFKTWTEYLNRLIGVLLGIALIGCFSLSFFTPHANPLLVRVFSGASVLSVGVQGWLGAKVVSSNLRPFVLTAHMSLALLLIFLLLGAYYFSLKKPTHQPIFNRYFYGLFFVGLGCFLAQFFLGTQVREAVDTLLQSGICRCCVGDQLAGKLGSHQAGALVVVMLHLPVIWTLLRDIAFRRLGLIWVGLLGSEVLLGFILANMNLPAAAQPAHLVISFCIFSLQIAIGYRLFLARKP